MFKRLKLFDSHLFFIILFLFGFVLFLLLSFVAIFRQYLFSLSNGDVLGNCYKFFNNYLPLIFVGIVGPAVLLPNLKHLFLRCTLIVFSVLIFLTLLIDNATFTLFKSRFIFSELFLFLSDVGAIFIFLIEFLCTFSGILMILSLICFVISLRLLWKIDNKINALYKVLMVVMFLLWGSFSKEPLFYESVFQNVFQINGFTFNVERNLQIDYLDNFKSHEFFDFDWRKLSGLNQKKNIIVLVVESLDCSVTLACHRSLGTYDLMPNLTKLSKKNLNFNNYYSNNSSTHSAYLSLVKSLPNFSFVSDSEDREQSSPYLVNDLIQKFDAAGYTTSFFSPCNLVYGMKEAVEYYTNVYTSDDPFYEKTQKRYIFNGVPDHDLYSFIIEKLKTEKSPFFYFAQTISTHKPYDSPLGDSDFKSAYKYADAQISYFVDELIKYDYFSNGILVITGDHLHWPSKEEAISNHYHFSENLMEKHRVPLLIIDGKNNFRVNPVYMSHSSLGVYLQSLMLPSYVKHRFNADPIHSNQSELIVHYEKDNRNYMSVKYGEKEDIIVLNGQKPFFVYHVFDQNTEQEILGFVSNCR